MLRGVLFDLGDTLLHYGVEEWSKVNRALNMDIYNKLVEQGQGSRLPPLDEFMELFNAGLQTKRALTQKTMRSHSMQDVLQIFFQEQHLDDLQTGDFMPIWYGRIRELTYLPDDVVPTLNMLRNKGLKLGLVSNTAWTAEFHDPDLKRNGLKDLLSCRIYSCEVGWEKPAPQIFHEALRCIELAPEEVAFVGDFLKYDVAGAHGVGMKGIWKRRDNRPEEADDHTIIPDGTITNLSELPEVLEQLYGRVHI